MTPGALGMASDGLDGPLGLVGDPLSALALAVSGMPSISLVEGNRPGWLPERLKGVDLCFALGRSVDAQGETEIVHWLGLDRVQHRIRFDPYQNAAEALEKMPEALSSMVWDMQQRVRDRARRRVAPERSRNTLGKALIDTDGLSRGIKEAALEAPSGSVGDEGSSD
jgi:hypothetical protein